MGEGQRLPPPANHHLLALPGKQRVASMLLDRRTLLARRQQARARTRAARRRLILAFLVGLCATALFALVLARGGQHAVATPQAPGAGAHRGGSPPAAQSQAIAHFLLLARPIYCAGPKVRTVALTFDDGPGPYTRLALRELAAGHAHATFFLVGRNLPGGARARPGAPHLLSEEQTLGAIDLCPSLPPRPHLRGGQ